VAKEPFTGKITKQAVKPLRWEGRSVSAEPVCSCALFEAQIAHGVIVTSGQPLHEELPEGVSFWSKPWAPLDVIREAERMVYERHRGDEAEPRPRS
jgi:hypothetical protein